jgi:predicted RNase H-like nuclease (RuvC/YqgF family)
MKKFVMDTKAALGTAPKTEDKDFDLKAAQVKGIERAVSDYKSAMEKMKSAATSLATAMEAMSKAFQVLSSGDDATEAMKSMANEYEAAARKVSDRILVDFKKAIDDHENMSAVKDLASECKKLEGTRNKVMAEYDTYREAVSKKEAEYKKKNKDLSDSKYYNEEVSKRDSLKADFEKADKEFKSKYEELEKAKILAFSDGMSAYLASTSQFIESIEKELASAVAKTGKGKK